MPSPFLIVFTSTNISAAGARGAVVARNVGCEESSAHEALEMARSKSVTRMVPPTRSPTRFSSRSRDTHTTKTRDPHPQSASAHSSASDANTGLTASAATGEKRRRRQRRDKAASAATPQAQPTTAQPATIRTASACHLRPAAFTHPPTGYARSTTRLPCHCPSPPVYHHTAVTRSAPPLTAPVLVWRRAASRIVEPRRQQQAW